MYFKTLNSGLLIEDSDLRLGNMQMLQIFNEFAWLVHLGIWVEFKNIKFKAFVEQQEIV